MLWIYSNFLKLRFSEQNHLWELNVIEVLISFRACPLPLRLLNTIWSQSLDPLHITSIHQSEVLEQTEALSLSFTSTYYCLSSSMYDSSSGVAVSPPPRYDLNLTSRATLMPAITALHLIIAPPPGALYLHSQWHGQKKNWKEDLQGPGTS